MALDNLAAYSKPHPGSIIFAAGMESLKGLENVFGKLLVKPDAVIFNTDLTYFPANFAMDSYTGFVATVFNTKFKLI